MVLNGAYLLESDGTAEFEDAAKALVPDLALVLTLVELLRELMERQAIRRVDQRDLTAVQVEQVGATLMALDERWMRYASTFI
jgi:hypothetical protein